MNQLYALLVGVDAYPRSIGPLGGCVNDVRAVDAHLAARVADPDALHRLVLCDAAATRAAVVSAFRAHLGRAGPGDTALYWFSGHGSSVPVPREWARTESTGRMQTTLCVDSRRDGVADLTDKELGLLISEVAARGVHVVAVLDCCYSDSGARDAAYAARGVAPAHDPPALDALLPELRGEGTRGAFAVPERRPDHVQLAACQADEPAYEVADAHGRRGVFTTALLTMLGRLGTSVTYRELVAGVRSLLDGTPHPQTPALYPSADPLADQPFLGGRLRRTATMSMGVVDGRWIVDAGACHGLPDGPPTDPTRLGVCGSDPLREVRVAEVLPQRGVVVPIGWEPDPLTRYQLVLTYVSTPATTVAIGGDPATGALLAGALRRAGPGGRPSPYVRVVPPDHPSGADVRADAGPPGSVTLRLGDGEPAVPGAWPVRDHADAARCVADIEHIARWRDIKARGNPMSRLAGRVQLELVAAPAGGGPPPMAGPALRPDATGQVVLEYRRGAYGWVPPRVFIRIRNNYPADLHCVLLDLTDRFRVHTGLFEGAPVGARYVAWAAGGQPIEFTLPAGQAAEPGASVRDWLMLLVSEQPFSTEPFALPGLGGLRPPADVTDRVGLATVPGTRGASRPLAHDWATSVHRVLTRVPR